MIYLNFLFLFFFPEFIKEEEIFGDHAVKENDNLCVFLNKFKMNQKDLHKSMGRLKTANKFRIETKFDECAIDDNLDINEEKENEINSVKDSKINLDNSKSESDSNESVAGPHFIVEKILRSRNRIGQKGLKEYLLKWKAQWKGCSVEKVAWESEETMDCEEMISEFEKKPYRGMFIISPSTQKSYQQLNAYM